MEDIQDIQAIQAGEFKAKCLSLLDEVSEHRMRFIITKRGKPVAELVPVETPKAGIFSKIKPTFEITGDIVGSTGESWDVGR